MHFYFLNARFWALINEDQAPAFEAVDTYHNLHDVAEYTYQSAKILLRPKS